MNGFLCIDKPLGPSSFAVTSAVRKRLGVKKTGHVGTLDPLASGLLVVALGDFTKLIQYLPAEPKGYEFTIRFGAQTETYDSEGKVTATTESFPAKAEIEKVIPQFTGQQHQVPPAYSAVKISGTPAYKLARKGEELTLNARKVTIHALELTGFNAGEHTADFNMTCSSGTYVRSLANDLAISLGSLGHVCKLRRTRVGVFGLENAVDFENIDNARKYIMAVRDIFDTDSIIRLDDQQVNQLYFGRDITVSDCRRNGPLIALDNKDKLTAVLCKVEDSRFHPEKVFIGSEL